MSAIQCFDGTIIYSNFNIRIFKKEKAKSISYSKQCNILSLRIFVSPIQKDLHTVPAIIVPVPNGNSFKMLRSSPLHKKGVSSTSWNNIEYFASKELINKKRKEYMDVLDNESNNQFGFLILYPKKGMHIYDKISYTHDVFQEENNYVYVPISHRKNNTTNQEKYWHFNNKVDILIITSKEKKIKIKKIIKGLKPNKDIFMKI